MIESFGKFYTMLCLMKGQPRNPRSIHPVTHAIMLTLLPPALLSIAVLNFAARSSMEADAGTEAVMTSIPLAVRASVIPRQ